MNKFLLAIPLFLCLSAAAQPFLALGATNKGANFQVGIVANKMEFTVAYKLPFSAVDVPSILSLSMSKLFFISHHEKDNYSFAPSIGVANYLVKNFDNYDADPTGKSAIIQEAVVKPLYGLEIGKDGYRGRVFISANYCKSFYFGMGMKVFPYR